MWEVATTRSPVGLGVPQGPPVADGRSSAAEKLADGPGKTWNNIPSVRCGTQECGTMWQMDVVTPLGRHAFEPMPHLDGLSPPLPPFPRHLNVGNVGTRKKHSHLWRPGCVPVNFMCLACNNVTLNSNGFLFILIHHYGGHPAPLQTLWFPESRDVMPVVALRKNGKRLCAYGHAPPLTGCRLTQRSFASATRHCI